MSYRLFRNSFWVVLLAFLLISASCQPKGSKSQKEARPQSASSSVTIANQEPELLSWIEYRGCCDASASVGLGGDWMAVANDENNALRVYSISEGGAPVWEVDWSDSEFLDLDRDHPEMDLEGAARVGDQVFWIASHGRNKSGKIRENRFRFFATTIIQPQTLPDESKESDPNDDGSPDDEPMPQPQLTTNTFPTLQPEGSAYSRLLSDLIRADAQWGFGLGAAAQRSPEDPDSLNIEALSAWPTKTTNNNNTSVANSSTSGGEIESEIQAGSVDQAKTEIDSSTNQIQEVATSGALAIGFRSPLKNGRAILIPLLNPLEMVQANAEAEFGDPVLLDLDGRGIRGMEMGVKPQPDTSVFYILAGPPHDEDRPPFRFYTWRFRERGNFRDSDLRSVFMSQGPLNGVTWESVISLESSAGRDLLLLADEGSEEINGVKCKDLPVDAPNNKIFHALRWPIGQ